MFEKITHRDFGGAENLEKVMKTNDETGCC